MKIVLFHSNCNDGLFSAYAFWKKYGSKDVIYIPVDYKPVHDMKPEEALIYIFNKHTDSPSKLNTGLPMLCIDDLIDNLANTDLYILDYSFPIEHFKQYTGIFKSITMYDHHATAIKEYIAEYVTDATIADNRTTINGNNYNIIFSTTESGAKLTYSLLFPEEPVPDYIELVSDRDLWTFNLENSKNFYHGLKFYNISTFNHIDVLLNTSKQSIVEFGKKYKFMYDSRLLKILKDNSINIDIYINNDKYTGCIINSYLDIASDICDLAIVDQEVDIVMAYNVYKDGKIGWSVRSKKGIDSAIVSKKFGGCGHLQASGFSSEYKFLSNIINKKQLIVNTLPFYKLAKNYIVNKLVTSITNMICVVGTPASIPSIHDVRKVEFSPELPLTQKNLTYSINKEDKL